MQGWGQFFTVASLLTSPNCPCNARPPSYARPLSYARPPKLGASSEISSNLFVIPDSFFMHRNIAKCHSFFVYFINELPYLDTPQSILIVDLF